jgi:hypothetical protein
MRALRLMLLPLLLAACENPFGGDVGRALSGAFGPTATQLDRMLIAEMESGEVDSAATQVRVGLGRRTATAMLIQQQGNRRMWRAPGGVVVETDGARVVATSGLRTIIMGTRFDGPDPLQAPSALLERSAETRRLVDLAADSREPATMRFGIAFDCFLRAARTEEQGILLVEERCRASGLSAVVNLFWAEEASGRVLQAEQWVGTGQPPMVISFAP